jgi:hypothetical protein
VKKMRAKYAGTCSECGGDVAVGDSVYWTRGEGVRHADAEVCDDHAALYDGRAEQAAEMRFEMGCAAHMMGTAYVAREGGFDDL